MQAKKRLQNDPSNKKLEKTLVFNVPEVTAPVIVSTPLKMELSDSKKTQKEIKAKIREKPLSFSSETKTQIEIIGTKYSIIVINALNEFETFVLKQRLLNKNRNTKGISNEKYLNIRIKVLILRIIWQRKTIPKARKAPFKTETEN